MKEANGTNNGTAEKTKNLPPWLSKVRLPKNNGIGDIDLKG
jgi:hypothetical protein